MANTVLHSVGIDIGTTTTQVIFSRLELVNRAALSQVPHYEFIGRDIIYVSPVVFTPVDFEGRIREEELLAFIEEQYRLAGHDTQEIETGAIIIWLKDIALPMRNIPVVYVAPETPATGGVLCKAWEKQILHMDLDPDTESYVLALPGELEVRWKNDEAENTTFW